MWHVTCDLWPVTCDLWPVLSHHNIDLVLQEISSGPVSVLPQPASPHSGENLPGLDPTIRISHHQEGRYSTEELSMAVATSCVSALILGFVAGFLLARKCQCGSDNPYHVPYLNRSVVCQEIWRKDMIFWPRSTLFIILIIFWIYKLRLQCELWSKHYQETVVFNKILLGQGLWEAIFFLSGMNISNAFLKRQFEAKAKWFVQF